MAFMTPRFDLYQKCADKIKNILKRYGSDVEPFGLDVYWMRLDTDNAKNAAEAIARDIQSETGLTASVGVSYNRSFARLASRLCVGCDVMVVTPDNFRELLWPMPVDSFLFVGSHTADKLTHAGIRTIGQLASTDVEVLERLLGAPGRTLWNDANGQGSSIISGKDSAVEAISNSWTLPRNATSFGEIVGAFSWLAENVARRAAAGDYTGRTLQISITDMTHVRQSRQMTLDYPRNDARGLLEGAMHLFHEYFNLNIPICALGLSLRDIEHKSAPGQMSFDNLAEAYPS